MALLGPRVSGAGPRGRWGPSGTVEAGEGCGAEGGASVCSHFTACCLGGGLFKGRKERVSSGGHLRRCLNPLRSAVKAALLSFQIEMAQKLLNSDLGELISKMKLAQQYVMTSLQHEYKKQMLTAAHALAVDAKNLLDVIDQARLKMLGQARPH